MFNITLWYFICIITNYRIFFRIVSWISIRRPSSPIFLLVLTAAFSSSWLHKALEAVLFLNTSIEKWVWGLSSWYLTLYVPCNELDLRSVFGNALSPKFKVCLYFTYGKTSRILTSIMKKYQKWHRYFQNSSALTLCISEWVVSPVLFREPFLSPSPLPNTCMTSSRSTLQSHVYFNRTVVTT
jgi:hypothetical protein